MTQEGKLKTIIEKAVNDGWTLFGFTNHEWYTNSIPAVKKGEPYLTVYQNERKSAPLRDDGNMTFVHNWQASEILFSHDFAKAFFGDAFPEKELRRANEPYWKIQLSLLAMTPPVERIDYLYKFING